MPGWARLSRAQKRDVMRLAGAGVLSTAFLALPLLLVPHSAPPAVAAETAAAPAATAVALPAIAGTRHSVTVRAHDVAVPVATPKLAPPQFQRERTRQSASVSLSAQRAPRPALARSKAPTLGARLGRMVAGDGRYPVRPFPTVGN